MGLFSRKKKEPKPEKEVTPKEEPRKRTFICPICGTEGRLTDKDIKLIKDAILCRSCYYKTQMDQFRYKTMTVEDIKEHLKYREQNKVLYESFKPSIIIEDPRQGVLRFEEDEERKLWTYRTPKAPNHTLYRYEDIVSYEYYENGKTVTAGGIGGAVIGEKLGGSTGALIGATVGQNTSYKITDMYILVRLNTPYMSSEKIFIYSTHHSYATCREYANKILTRLEIMCAQAKKDKEAQTVAVASSDPTEEIRKYKALLDDGIITQEEFDAKKKQLLGL